GRKRADPRARRKKKKKKKDEPVQLQEQDVQAEEKHRRGHQAVPAQEIRGGDARFRKSPPGGNAARGRGSERVVGSEQYEYHWCDGQQFKKPTKVSAPEYVDYLMTWVQSQLDDENVFPSKIGVPFPKNFPSVVKNIFKRLFRVYAHIYHSHFPKIVSLGEEAHLNTSFKHFVFFVQEFGLIDKKELAPMQELIDSLTSESQ
ncbi:MAG: Mps1 binder-like protein, partial [Olpidium bornovanus]